MTDKETLIRLYEDPKSRAQCRGCSADIEWHETLTGRRMPMNAGAVPRKSDTHLDSRRVIGFYAASDAHWTTCPDAAQFGRKSRQ
jgi:hypothetical protein